MDGADRASGQLDCLAQCVTVRQRQALQDAADDGALVLGQMLADAGAVLGEAGRQVAGGEELGGAGVDECRERSGGGGAFEQVGQVVALATGAPGAPALAEQPQAHDVAQVADGAVDTEFVGEVGGAGGICEDGRVEFEAGERPGAAGDVGEVLGGRGDGGDRGGCVVGGDRDHGGVGAQAGGGGDVRKDGAGVVAGAAQCGQEGRVQVERGEDRGGPGAGAGVVQARGGGVGHLRADGAGEPVGDQIGQQEQGAGAVEVLLGGELEDRVERHVLKAGDPVQLTGREAAPDGLDGGGAARVAVVERVAEERAVGVEEPVVDGPAVDADGGEVPASGGLAEAVQNALVQAEGVPVQPVRELDGSVVEAVGLGEVEAVTADAADEHPSAGGAEVRRGEGGRGVERAGRHGRLSAGRPRRRRRRRGCGGRWCG